MDLVVFPDKHFWDQKGHFATNVLVGPISKVRHVLESGEKSINKIQKRFGFRPKKILDLENSGIESSLFYMGKVAKMTV